MLRELPQAASALLAGQHGVATATQLRGLGVSTSTLQTAVRRQLLLNPHRGVYVDRATWRSASDGARHAMRLRAVLLVAPDAVGLGPTAAVVSGAPVRRIPDRPLVARAPDRGRVTGAVITRRPIPDEAIAVVDGLRVVTLAHAVVSIAASAPLADALITADAALRQGVPYDDLQRHLEQLTHAAERSRAEPVIAFADPWSESWLESLSRGRMVEREMPIPLCNVTLIAAGREARPDDLWAELGVIGESDGKGKYERQPGDVAAAHWREKRRHEWLQELGFEIARWGTPEVAGSGAAMQRRFDQAAQRQAAVGFRWPPGVRAELRGIAGVTPPPQIVREVARLRSLGYPIDLVPAERSVSRDSAAAFG